MQTRQEQQKYQHHSIPSIVMSFTSSPFTIKPGGRGAMFSRGVLGHDLDRLESAELERAASARKVFAVLGKL